MVEVFKTNVQEICEGKILIELLMQYFPETKINFDLEDCDKILRMEGENLKPVNVIKLVNENGYNCEALE